MELLFEAERPAEPVPTMLVSMIVASTIQVLTIGLRLNHIELLPKTTRARPLPPKGPVRQIQPRPKDAGDIDDSAACLGGVPLPVWVSA